MITSQFLIQQAEKLKLLAAICADQEVARSIELVALSLLSAVTEDARHHAESAPQKPYRQVSSNRFRPVQPTLLFALYRKIFNNCANPVQLDPH